MNVVVDPAGGSQVVVNYVPQQETYVNHLFPLPGTIFHQISAWLVSPLPLSLYPNVTLSMRPTLTTQTKKRPFPDTSCLPYLGLFFLIVLLSIMTYNIITHLQRLMVGPEWRVHSGPPQTRPHQREWPGDPTAGRAAPSHYQRPAGPPPSEDDCEGEGISLGLLRLDHCH